MVEMRYSRTILEDLLLKFYNKVIKIYYNLFYGLYRTSLKWLLTLNRSELLNIK